MSDASSLTVEEKIKIVNDILIPLRSYQMLGLIESRAWLEVLFPEFGTFRDREMEDILVNGQDRPQDVEEEEDVD